MKTTFYISFAIVNSSTHNFLLGVTSSDDEQFIDKIKKERDFTTINPSLRDYVFAHPESYNKVQSFVETLKYFDSSNFEARMLGVFIEQAEAEKRIQLALDGFSRNKGQRLYYNECYNLKKSIENETEEQNKIKAVTTHLKEAGDQHTKETDSTNHKSEVKKQSITIIEIESGEEHHFDTKGECMKFLGCATDTFSRFLKGKTKLNKKYTIKENTNSSFSN